MKKLVVFLFVSLALVACTDYGADYEDKYKNLLVTCDEDEDSSSSMEISSSSDSSILTSSSGKKVPSSSNSVSSSSSSKNESSSSNSVLSSSSSENESSSSNSVPSSSSSENESSSSNSVSSSSSSENESDSSSSISSGNFIEYGTLIDLRDNQIYKTVTIGSQTWMAENLNYAYNEKTSSLDSSSFCYNNSADYCSKFGRLYLWSAAMDSAAVFSTAGKDCGYGVICSASGIIRGTCPEGWHLPNKAEWSVLFTAVGGIGTAGTKLKSSSDWYNDGNGEDSYGFTILPAGYRDRGGYRNERSYAIFWNSTEHYSDGAYDWNFYYFDPAVNENGHLKSQAESIRCIKDDDSPIEYGTLIDSRDYQTYKTVTIGTQTWMAENLNYAYNEKTSSLDSSSFCYNNEPDSCSKYGRLYLWSAAMDSTSVFGEGGRECGYGVKCSATGPVRGVCPDRWHLPSRIEWSTLFTAVGGTSTAGMMLKSTNGWYDDGNGEDFKGFSVLPTGYRELGGSFFNAGYGAYFWSFTENGSNNAYDWYFYYRDANMYESDDNKYRAFSVRCVKD